MLDEINLFLDNYDFLKYSFLGNKIGEYILFLVFFVFLFFLLMIFRVIVLKRIRSIIGKKESKISEIIISFIDSIKPSFFWFAAFYLSATVLNLAPAISKTIDAIILIWVAYYLVIISHLLVEYGLKRYAKKEKDPEAQNSILILGKIAKGVLWIIATLLVLSNLGVNVTSLMAGLGIGGVAIAFALQNILSDLFSSFAIYFDKPFIVGDFIIVGDHIGTVEKIGIKTTRLRALQGEEIVISNRELTSARIQNFKKMQKRRIVFSFGLTYETPVAKLKKANEIVSEAIQKEKLSEFDRIHFTKFGDSALNFEVVYNILSGDYTDFMNTHESILFKIKESFEKEKISMAFPTQTIYLNK